MLGTIIAFSGKSQVPSVTFLVADVFSSNSALHKVLAFFFFFSYLSKLRNHNLQLFGAIVIKEKRNGNEREDLVILG